MSSSSGHRTGVDDPDFENKLLVYYQRLFPFRLLHDWLSYGSEELFHCREFAFWFAGPRGGGGGGENFFVRYQCYTTEELFRIALSTRQSKFNQQVVERMEIGPIYKCSPDQHHRAGCLPDTREFVVDVDMDDYNSVRNCCQGANVCSSCWVVMTIAVKVIDASLRQEFGFKHLLWVFSGRRGVHCWVSDDAARRLSRKERKTIINFLSLDKTGGLTSPLYPHFERAYSTVLLRYFESRVLVEQDLLRDERSRDHVLDMLPDDIAAALRKAWNDDSQHDSKYRWTQLVKTVQDQLGRDAKRVVAGIVFEYTYPRFDVKVSEDLNHLLKSPFCVHPKTGFVSVPIDPNNCDAFDPTKNAPSLQGLVAGLNSADQNIDQLAFEESLKYFEHRFLRPLERTRKTAAATDDDLEDIVRQSR